MQLIEYVVRHKSLALLLVDASLYRCSVHQRLV